MAAVCVIPVNLGIEVEQIIQEEMLTFTEETSQQLTEYIATSQQALVIKEQKTHAKSSADQAIQDAYAALLTAGDAGLPVSEVLKLVGNNVSTPSAFTLRMRAHLRHIDSPYEMLRIKSHIPRYKFVPYDPAIVEPPPE